MRRLALAVFFLIATVVVTYPLPLRLADHVPENPGDTLLVAWILAWDVHALGSAPLRLFDANILYPIEKTLALSEHLLGVVPLFVIPHVLTGNSIIGLNIVILLSFVLSGMSVYALVRRLGGGVGAALVAGTVFAFAPVRTSQTGHPQLLQFYWTPFALLALERYFESRRRRDLAVFAGLWVVQCLSSVYLAFISSVAIAVYAAIRVLVERRLHDVGLLARGAVAMLGAAVVVGLVHLPYVAVERAWGRPWTPDVLVSFSASPADYVAGGFVAAGVGNLGSRINSWEKTVGLGVVAWLLVALGAVLRVGAARRVRFGSEVAWWALLLVGFVLSLGPSLVLNDRATAVALPYAWLQHAPGFAAMRVPARFGILVSLAAAVLAGLGWQRLGALLASRSKLTVPAVGAAVLVCVLFLGETWRGPLPTAAVPTGARVPEVYRWLATRPGGGPIAELPRGLWEDYRYAYLSTVHWKRLVNGSSGFIPPAHAEVVSYLDRLPDRHAADVLSRIGVREVVVHHAALTARAAARWTAEAAAAAGLREVARFGADRVYGLPPPEEPGPGALDASVALESARGHWLPLALSIRGRGPGPWIHPRPLGRTPVMGHWTCSGDDGREVVLGYVLVPLVIDEGRTETYSSRVRRPERPGPCMLRTTLPRLGVATPPVAFAAAPRR